MARPRVLIEQWLPIDQIGAECMRERGASSALPPLYPTGDEDIRPWPEKFRKRFPTFDAYKHWFLGLIGILGDPAASRKIIHWARAQGIKLTPDIIGRLPKEWTQNLPRDMGVSIPYGYPRAFTNSPKEEQLETLYDLLEWMWGTREITFCDPMSGGGSIPFEALRFGLTVHANELNPVASVILKATLDYPARFGLELTKEIEKWGKALSDRIAERLRPFFPRQAGEDIFVYIWCRTVACPHTGKPVPLSPNWWLEKLTKTVRGREVRHGTAMRPMFPADASVAEFDIVNVEGKNHLTLTSGRFGAEAESRRGLKITRLKVTTSRLRRKPDAWGNNYVLWAL